MKKKYIIFSIVTLVLLVALITSFNYFKTTNTYIDDSASKSTKITKGISMNLEQTAGAGDYKTVTQSGWPTEGYKFNAELSRCENGSELSWDDTKKAVIVSGNLSDKCYVYFDIWIPSIADYCTGGTDLATCVKNFGDQGSSVSSIYIHDSSLTNGAEDNSYRYAGANPSNYVCFGSTESTCPDANLFRIIGVFGDKTKVIRAKSVGNKQWHSSRVNTWSSSSLNTYLNGEYLTSLGTLAEKIATTTWKVGGGTSANIREVVPKTAYQYEVGSNASTPTLDKKIGLMYVSDYYYAASPSAWTLVGYNSSGATKDYRVATSINWLYLGSNEWTLSRFSDLSDTAFFVGYAGYVSNGGVDNLIGVRPSFNLLPSTTYVSGSGSMSDPVRIN